MKRYCEGLGGEWVYWKTGFIVTAFKLGGMKVGVDKGRSEDR
jgi:hypothetical protein